MHRRTLVCRALHTSGRFSLVTQYKNDSSRVYMPQRKTDDTGTYHVAPSEVTWRTASLGRTWRDLVFPRLFRLEGALRAALVPPIAGAVGTGYSLIITYQLGVLKVLPMPAHLAFDAAKGVFMASSPWLFGFARNGTRYWLPHLLMGMADVLAAATSKTGRDPYGRPEDFMRERVL